MEIIAEGKGARPHEIIVDMESFFIKPDKEFWEKTEIFSELKLTAVNDENYENSKYLYQTLKMRSLDDLNDLYNTQEVILLTEIIESRFQAWLVLTLEDVIQLVQWAAVLKEECLKLF